MVAVSRPGFEQEPLPDEGTLNIGNTSPPGLLGRIACFNANSMACHGYQTVREAYLEHFGKSGSSALDQAADLDSLP